MTLTTRVFSRSNAKLQARKLESYEQIQYGDIVEDIQAGDRSRAEKGTFYGSLVGVTAGQLKQLPQVNEVFREEVHYDYD